MHQQLLIAHIFPITFPGAIGVVMEFIRFRTRLKALTLFCCGEEVGREYCGFFFFLETNGTGGLDWNLASFNLLLEK